MVIRVRGSEKPQNNKTEKTRTTNSLTAASGRPTRINFGSPASLALTSTCTVSASMPCSAADEIVANMRHGSGRRGQGCRVLCHEASSEPVASQIHCNTKVNTTSERVIYL